MIELSRRVVLALGAMAAGGIAQKEREKRGRALVDSRESQGRPPRFERDDNINTVMARAWLCLRDNPLLRIPEKPGQYWGALSEQRGDVPVGNGRAVWAMYGTSFQVVLFALLSREMDDREAVRLLGKAEEYLLDSPVRVTEPKGLEGTWWSQENIFSRFRKGTKIPQFSDQAFRKRIWTHASGWIAYMLSEAYRFTKNESYLECIRKAVFWLLRTQRDDGSWPHSWLPFDPPKPSKGICGDAWWAIVALIKGMELGLIDKVSKAKGAVRKALEFLDREVAVKNRYFGSFEDVGGPADGYSPFHAVSALIDAAEFLEDEELYSRAERAWKQSRKWVSHKPSPWLIGESERIPTPSSSNMAMMSQAAAQLLRHDARNKEYARAAAGLAFLSKRQRRDPSNRYFGGIDWYDQRTNFSGGWFQAQALLRGRWSLCARASCIEGVELKRSMDGTIFCKPVERVHFSWPGTASQASKVRFTPSKEVDYLVVETKENFYAVFMNDSGYPGSVEIRLDFCTCRPKPRGQRPKLTAKIVGSDRPLTDGQFLTVHTPVIMEWEKRK